MEAFYQSFESIRKLKFDGMIVTGAPVELLNFEDVDYWDEMKEIMTWADHNVTSTFYICWAAQAGLYFHYGIPKYPVNKKVFGIFNHFLNNSKVPLVRGFDDEFFAPHSRHTEIKREDIQKIKDLEIISESDEAGVYIVMSKDGRRIFVTGHSEYDSVTLKEEYERDLSKGQNINLPKNYFPNDDPAKPPRVIWKGHSSLLFSNWLNYYVYQQTPYQLEEIR